MVRAHAAEPGLRLPDEPTASLDPQATAAIEALVGQAAASGVKIVMVTHDRGKAQRLADDVLFLHHGRLAAHSADAAFFHKPTRSDERRVGQECVSKCGYRGSPYH